MIKYFFKSAFRNIVKNRIYSFLNLIGLSIGIASFLLLFLWVKDELSYNNFHENYAKIYRLYSEYQERDNVWQTPLTPDLAAPQLIEQYPGIKNAVRLNNKPSTVKVGDDIFNEEKLFYTDPSFFDIFTAPVTQGDPVIALNDPNSVVITSQIAKKYFGNKNPINQSIVLDGKFEFKIGAVVNGFPNNSDIKFDLLVPYKFLENNNLMWSYWSFGRIETYILSNEEITKDQINSEIKDFVDDKAPDLGFIFKVQALEQVHLYSLTGIKEGMKSVQIFALIAACVLLIACFNFINLTTAQYTKRVKEISLKQILGGSKLSLIKNIFFETLLFVFLSGIVALILIELFRVPFNIISAKDLVINYLDFSFIVNIFLIFIITSLFSAIYPAYFISRFSLLSALSGEITKGIRGRRMRKFIVIVQFSISIVLIISSIVVFKQFKFIENKNLGYNTENVVCIPIKGSAKQNYGIIKEQLKKCQFIENVSLVSEIPSFVGIGTSNFDYEGKDPSDDKGFTILSVDHELLETIDLKLVMGRNFSLERISDSTNYILNETAIKYMGLKNPIGSRFSMFGAEGEIIGVVEDFHFLPLNQQVGPIFLAIIPNYYDQFLVKIKSNEIKNGINQIEEVWNKFLPDYAFEYEFWDDFNKSMYSSEARLINIFLFFTFFGILIASLGLVGLSIFNTEIKTKEIGIRKTNGAQISNILRLFVQEYNTWFLISIVISCPVAFYLMNKWLLNYAYRIEITFWIFIISIILAYLIGILSIFIQSFKAARRNPIESLRYE